MISLHLSLRAYQGDERREPCFELTSSMTRARAPAPN